MQLMKILEIVNQWERNSFLKILEQLAKENRKSHPNAEKIIALADGQIKNAEDREIGKLFTYLRNPYKEFLEKRLNNNPKQLDILVDIVMRDGNSFMSREWFSQLYERELKKLKSDIKAYNDDIQQDSAYQEGNRLRDYRIYQECLKTAYKNDDKGNRDRQVTGDEWSILNTLSVNLELSNQEIRWIDYSILNLEKADIDVLLTEIRESGIGFYNRRTYTLYIPDEIVWILREINDMELPNKYLRRIFHCLTNAEINQIARKYNLDAKMDQKDKIEALLDSGLNATRLLQNDIFKPSTTKTDKANRLLSLIEKGICIDLPKYGRSLEERIELIIKYYQELEKDESTSLTRDGYNRLLYDLSSTFRDINRLIKLEFQLQEENVLNSGLLSSHDVKPADVLYLLSRDQLKEFTKKFGIKSVGNLIVNIIGNYRIVEDLLMENLELVGARDIASLKEQGIEIKESEFGLLYENLIKKIFTKLGFSVDESLRKEINTKQHQMDILLRSAEELIIIECKTVKDKDYNKYTSVSRQLKSYEGLCKQKGYNVGQVVVIANSFSNDFISDCEYDHELNLSLITSKGLLKTMDALIESKFEEFPVKLLKKDGLLDEERICKVLLK